MVSKEAETDAVAHPSGIATICKFMHFAHNRVGELQGTAQAPHKFRSRCCSLSEDEPCRTEVTNIQRHQKVVPGCHCLFTLLSHAQTTDHSWCCLR